MGDRPCWLRRVTALNFVLFVVIAISNLVRGDLIGLVFAGLAAYWLTLLWRDL